MNVRGLQSALGSPPDPRSGKVGADRSMQTRQVEMSDHLGLERLDHFADESVIALTQLLKPATLVHGGAKLGGRLVDRNLADMVHGSHHVVEGVSRAERLHRVNVTRGRDDFGLEAPQDHQPILELTLQPAARRRVGFELALQSLDRVSLATLRLVQKASLAAWSMLRDSVGAKSGRHCGFEDVLERAFGVLAVGAAVTAVQRNLPGCRSHVSRVPVAAGEGELARPRLLARQSAPIMNDPAAAEHYLAIDLGASSGRVMVGRFNGERLTVQELHRFENPVIEVLGSLHWDVLRLFLDLQQGLQAAAQARPVSLGVDTWGVDFALLNRDGELLGNPHHYRDARTSGKIEEALELVEKEEIFEQTGLQFMEINTLIQLFSMKGTAQLEAASSLLMMPDLFHYWFTGEQACEFTDATTSQCYDPRRGQWAFPLLEALGLPNRIFGTVVEPGTVLGGLRQAVADACRLPPMRVVAPGTHDTASAVAAVPAADRDWAYLSSGTWSLLGVESERPHITPVVLQKNFTNEGGVCHTTRLLKNICGLWLLEECRREWVRQGVETQYGALAAQAAGSEAFRSLIDVDDPAFLAPGDMPGRIAWACRRSGQPEPETTGEFARAIFESLALKYRIVLADLAAITGRSPATLHIVGGGSQNQMLCQYASDACGIPVVAGPVEATAAGNVLMQGLAAGRIGDLDQLREIVRGSFPLVRYEPDPRSAAGWREAADRLSHLGPG